VSDTAGQFTSPLVAQGESTLVGGIDKLAPGAYAFHCELHSWMNGVIDVVAPGTVPAPPPIPSPDPSNPPNPVDLLPHAAPAPLTGGEWPFYGKDLANSRDGAGHGPAATDAPFLKPVWSVKATDGDFVGTPVEAGNTVVGVSGGGTVSASAEVTGRFAIATASVDTRNAQRDSHLRGTDFFSSEQYPEITFSLDALTPADQHVTVSGTLTVRDTSRRISFPATVALSGDDEAAFDAHAQLPNTLQFVEQMERLIDHPFDISRTRAIA